MTTIEGNKLIAEFMGYTKRHINWFNADQYKVNRWMSENELKYHSSWDWLIPVVEKISKELECKFHLYNTYLLEDDSRKDFLVFRLSLDELFSACVEFINWYNTNKK